MEYHSTGYKKAALTLTLKPAENPTGISAQSLDQAFTKTLATITFHIDKTLDTTVNSFTYTVSSIQYTDSNGNKGTSALPGQDPAALRVLSAAGQSPGGGPRLGDHRSGPGQ